MIGTKDHKADSLTTTAWEVFLIWQYKTLAGIKYLQEKKKRKEKGQTFQNCAH